MNRPPAFQFYVRDFLSDENVVLMTLEEKGAYIVLLCFNWQEGSVPNDAAKLARLCGVDGDAMARLWPGLRPCFPEVDGDHTRLANPRLAAERQKQQDYHRKLSDAGKLGAEATHGKQVKDSGKANGHDKAKPTKGQGPRQPSSFASSSSTLSPESAGEKGLKAEPNTAQARLRERFAALWKEAYPDAIPPTLAKSDFVNLATLVAKSSEPKVGDAIAAYLRDRDPYLTERNHPIGLFFTRASQYSGNGTHRSAPSQPVNRRFNLQ